MTISRILTHVTESAKKKQEKLENALEEITTNFFFIDFMKIINPHFQESQ